MKIAISAILVYFIFTKVDFAEVWTILKRTNPFYFFLAAILFVLSKMIAAFRLNLYFHRLKIFLTQKSNLKLYLLGMFYNLFLPGGIGGDAYKGYLIKKKFEVSTKKVISVLLLDRLSGLLLLFVYACILATVVDNQDLQGLRPWFVVAILLSIISFWLLNRRFFKDMLPVFWMSFLHSAIVQLAQLASAYFILKSLGIVLDTIAYLFIFLVSSIVSVIPLTIGGIGSREVTFYYGATLFGLDQTSSISISMVFFFISALVSFLGIYYHFKKVDLDVKAGNNETKN
ncbi:lysylphosphatidylglycerol synthase transmembrane domain-containing protein [Maribacter algicola]|uniref:Lysylphosphatidylglycerol synthase transmembrane domain-containing protein n=1 Tax=Meishania litoralis TaxID=3434685 RepID=A0ACC7LFN0_9FLAO